MATNNKYDRQLRLWGAQGQRALGETQAVLVGATAAGTETLKNLVLPGIGSFSVVDDTLVSHEDVATNFFLTKVGSTRAEASAAYLKELNPDVLGMHTHVSSLTEVSDWGEVLSKHSNGRKLLVIMSDLSPSIVPSLSTACDKLGVPLIEVRSYGLIGLVRLQLAGKVALLNPKPTNVHPDLRLKAPFSTFEAMARSIDLKALESHQHGHVPYPIILYHALQEWRSGHNGEVPSSFSQKQEFIQLVRSMQLNDNEVNFDEAIQNAYLAYTEQSVDFPEDIDPSSTLGVLFEGLKNFMKQHGGRAPLNGSIPDMTASTELYVRLQEVYKDQANKDLEEMKVLCSRVPPEDVASFCSNVFTVQQIETRPIADEGREPPQDELVDDLKMALMDPYEISEHTPLLWLLGLKACLAFYRKNGRYPGTIEDWELDVVLVVEFFNEIVRHYKLEDQDSIDQSHYNICHELTRYANAEIHNIASVVGGVASQEAVKIITGQYVPLDNTYVYNGIASVAGVYRL